MGITAAELIARVSVQGAAAAEGQLLGVGKASDAAEARFRSLAVVGSGLLVAGLVGVGIASVKMAGDFQQGVNRLRTGAGDSQDSFNSLTKGILGVSVATGQMTRPLVDAMYLILSSGQRGAQAFDTLKVAAEGAVIEQAKVADVANVLSGVMTNYGTKVYGATQYMNGLVFAVAHGKITLQDLAVAMGPIDPIAQHLGISMADVAAAMTTQTNAMIPAAIAATGLRFMMSALENPTHKANAAMAKLGLDSVKVAEEMKVSLPAALQMIVQAALKVGPEGSVPFNRAVGDMVGGVKGLRTFMALTGEHMKDFIANSQGITAAMKNGAGGVQGWAIAQSNFNVQMDRAKASVAAAGIGLGLLLLPALTHLASLIPAVVQYFSDFSSHAGVLVPILAGIGAVIVGLLVPAVWSLAAGVIAATWPVLLIGAAIAGLVAIFMHLYSSSAPFKAFIDNLVVGFKQLAVWVQANVVPALQAFGAAALRVGGFLMDNLVPAAMAVGAFFMRYILPVLKQIGAFLASTFAPMWQQLVQVWNGQILPSLKQLWEALQPLAPLLQGLAIVVGGILVVAFALFVGTLAGLIRFIATFIGGLAQAIGGIIQIFSGVFQVVLGIVKFFIDLFTGNFKGLESDLNQIMRGIALIFSGILNVIQGIWKMAIGSIVSFVMGFVQAIIGFFTMLYNALVGHSIVPNMINGIVTWFASLPGRVFSFVSGLVLGVINFFLSLAQRAIAAVQNLVSGVINWFSQLPGRALGAVAGLAGMLAGFFGNLAGQALNWGANIINNIAAGIQGAIGAVAGAIGNVANFIASHLPRSPAKLGPLRDLELQGAQIVAQLSKGMSGAMPALQGQLHLMLSPVVSPGNLSAPGLSASYALRSASGGQTIVINVAPPDVTLDGQRLTRAQMPYIVNAIRANAPARF